MKQAFNSARDNFGLLLIISWLALSMVYMTSPEAFQRLGAYGVAVSIVGLSLQAQILRAREAEAMDDLEQAYAQFEEQFRHFDSSAYLSICQMFRELKQGAADDDFEIQLGRIEKAVRMRQEIELPQSNLRSAKFDVRIGWLKFKLEFLTVVIATLQAGYGDLLSSWLVAH